MENKQYYILEEDIKKGPFTLEELQSLVVKADTKIWYPGLDKWTKASKIPGLHNYLNLLPPDTSSRNKWLIPLLAIIIVGLGAFAGSKYLQDEKEPQVVLESPRLNNQQLYTLLSPGVVLIQHEYIFEINTGVRKFYFNEFFDYRNSGYISGLTSDSTKAVKEARGIEGTGFFVSKNGMLLTNRHVALAGLSPGAQERIAGSLVRQLNQQVDYNAELDSIRKSKAQNDSLLTLMLQDTLADVVKITDIKEKIAEAQLILDEEDAMKGEVTDTTKYDQETVNKIAMGDITVRKITLDLRIFLPGAKNTDKGNGIECKIVANADDPEIDLALIQVWNGRLPEPGITLPDLSRIASCENESYMPQMSERLILIGYNRGADLSETTEGMKAQLTEGKISQNTDRYKLMYTIPTLPGSSGSPVLDEKGRLVSVNFAGVSYTQSFNYGIQPVRIREFLKSYAVAN